MHRRYALGMIIALGLVLGVSAGCRSDQEAQVAATLEEIQTEIDAGNYESARTELETILSEDAENAEARFKLGLVYFNLGDYQLARENFEQSLALEPDRAGAVHHNLGVLAYQMGDMDTALQEFQAALETDPDDADTHYQLGATYLIQAFPVDAMEPDAALLAKAEAEFGRALEIAPRKPEALVGLANVYMLRNEMREAVDLLEDAVEQAPQMREALFALGRAYAAVGELDQAKATLRQFLDTDPPAMWAQQAEEMLRELDGESTD
ncbi:MAG: tetratricopeptide repeat protein [Anaerolineae bacterium]